MLRPRNCIAIQVYFFGLTLRLTGKFNGLGLPREQQFAFAENAKIPGAEFILSAIAKKSSDKEF